MFELDFMTGLFCVNQTAKILQNCLYGGSGIDHDIKIWAPTATERRIPGKEAHRVMHENKTAQGSASNGIVISPLILARLMGFSASRSGGWLLV